jgi:hypothetical protein
VAEFERSVAEAIEAGAQGVIRLASPDLSLIAAWGKVLSELLPDAQ